MTSAGHIKFLALYEPVHIQFERYCRANAYGTFPPDDLINETLLVAYQRFHTLRSSDSFLAFLIGIARRILANANRKKREAAVDDVNMITLIDSSANVDQNMEVELLYCLLSKLPKEQKEALTLYEILGFSVQEISSIQRAGKSAVKQRLSRGRKALKDLLQKSHSYKSESQ